MELSLAYGTVDHELLLKKMTFYRIHYKEVEFMKWDLADRMNFTDIETKRSRFREQKEFLLIQGSKISYLLYSI